MRKTVSGIIVILLLTSILSSLFIIQPVKANGGTIYVRADGSIDPSTAPIQRDGSVYTFTSSIYGNSIVIERDNIILDGNGFTLEGIETKTNFFGINLFSRTGVIIKNIEIKNFDHGIYLHESSGISISGNTIMSNTYCGVVLMSSNNILIFKNSITDNRDGIDGYDSSYNTISQNLIAENGYSGIILYNSSSTYNIVSANVITYNNIGLLLIGDYNIVYHNDFIDNTNQGLDWRCFNTWDNGYPSGGNYWSDYIGTDEKSGPNQDQLGSDGIGDIPYMIEGNRDRYPLINPWGSAPPPPPTPDFSIWVYPISQTITPRQPTTYTITITSIADFSSPVTLSSLINPSCKEISLTFDSASVTPPPDGSTESMLTVSTTGKVKTNFYTITIIGSDEDKTHSATVTLIIALYELFFEIDYMEDHKPTDSVLTYIQNYYIERGISLKFHVDDTVPYDSVVTKTEFWAIENEYNNKGDDWACGDHRTGVYFSKWKWVLFGAEYEKPWNGFCNVPLTDEEELAWILSTNGGNYIFIADKLNDDAASGWSSEGVTPEEVEAVVLMHEMGHSIGILNLRLDLFDDDGDGDRLEWIEFYDLNSKSVMARLTTKNCNADPIGYSIYYWMMKNLQYYKV